MSINNIVITTLSTLKVPVEYLVYTGTASTYITFFKYNEKGTMQADDEEQMTRHSVQVDIWGKGNIEALTKQVKTNLQAVGFTRVGFFEGYEKDTKLYHKAYRFYYSEEVI